MSALKMILAGGVAAAALVSAASASAQYYPGNPYGYGGGYGGKVIYDGYGGYGGYGGHGTNSQAAISQCTAAVTQRLNRDQGGYRAYGGGYGAYGGGYGTYGGGYGNARVLGISRVEPSSGGGLTIRGVASSGFNAGYGGYGNEGNSGPDVPVPDRLSRLCRRRRRRSRAAQLRQQLSAALRQSLLGLRLPPLLSFIGITRGASESRDSGALFVLSVPDGTAA